MPVVTRSQARLLQQAGQTEESLDNLPKPKELLRVGRKLTDDNSETEVLTPRSLNASVNSQDNPFKSGLASKPPVSHPLVEETAALSLADSPAPKGSSAVPSNDVAMETSNDTAPAAASREAPSQQAPCDAAPPKRRLAPEEKLLKPFPDKPVECTKLPDGPEPVVIEIEYTPTEDLQPIDGDVATALSEALQGIASPEWAEACTALTVLRRAATHHAAACTPALPQAVPHVIKAAKSLRSTLSKTAIMTLRDLYLTCAEEMLPLTDIGGPAQPLTSALAQLLLKAASNDKKFVIEEAQRTIITMAENLPPVGFLTLLIPYTEHKNPKVRGKTATVVAACVERLSPSDIHAFGFKVMLTTTSKLITDNTPEAREGAKKVAAAIKAAFDDEQVAILLNIEVPAPVATESPVKELTPWEFFCQSELGGPLKAGPVLRATAA